MISFYARLTAALAFSFAAGAMPAGGGMNTVLAALLTLLAILAAPEPKR